MSKDTVSALDGIKEVLKQTQAELPAVDSDDNGKVLTVKSGKWDKADVPVELPAVTDADEGKVLMVNAEGKWVAATLPANAENNEEVS